MVGLSFNACLSKIALSRVAMLNRITRGFMFSIAVIKDGKSHATPGLTTP
jgi:hypothetical protein